VKLGAVLISPDLDRPARLELLRVLVDVLRKRREKDAFFLGALIVEDLPDRDEREDEGDPKQDGFMTLSQSGILSTYRVTTVESIAAKGRTVKG
jgi:hypothetical protein